MSRYEYRYETSNERLDIKTSADPRNVFMWVHEGRNQAAILVPKADVPTVAAELLKAAGRAELAGMIEAVEADRTARAEREAAEKKLQERRDALMGDLFSGLEYAEADNHAQGAVDRIIELEDELDGASRD